MTPNLETRDRIRQNAVKTSGAPVSEDYPRAAAERFGLDAQISIICALEPDRRVDQPIIDKHIENAYRFARIAFHYAAFCVSPVRRMDYLSEDFRVTRPW